MDFWKGDKIRLRAVQENDLDNYFCSDESKDSESDRKCDRIIFPTSPLTMKDRIESLSKRNPYDDECFLIIENLQGIPIGSINTHSIDKTNGIFMFGFSIRKKYRRNGYASEAVKLLLSFYFFELRFEKVETRVYSFNKESIAFHEKLGFKKEGVLRRNHFTSNKYHDTVCFGLLKEEYMNISSPK